MRDGWTAVEEVWLDVEFKGLAMKNAVRADLIVEDCVVIELKAAEEFHPIHRSQLLSYLKASGKSLGILFNFGSDLILKNGCERVVHPRYLVPSTTP